ncbi:MAG: Rne/Rng family ribonuclease [Parvularculaceae bacterium]
MTKQMLIDAAHPEEVRVCVLENGKVEEFDFELSARKPLRGNIYLARVTRVEPSLQAAFVEYGGNRHGFLAFNEIHPDYYQIPVSDRRALQEAEAEEAELAAALEIGQRGDEHMGGVDDDDFDLDAGAEDGASEASSDEDDEEESEASAEAESDDADAVEGEISEDESGDNSEAPAKSDEAALNAAPLESISSEASASDEDEAEQEASEEETADEDAEAGDEDSNEANAAAETEASGETETAEAPTDEAPAKPEGKSEKRGARRAELLERYKEARRKRARLLRNYKIQEVIKRRQILLVQVVKEERGNKGAALTTYLSLAGRYCVLMPNTARGGGISRKIPTPTDRKRLRRVVDSLEVPKGMGLIIRTAGAKRTKAEIKRDYDYLIRLWENIRSHTLNSIAPCLIYEEANLMKRAIRDLYDKDISIIQVEGEAGYREAKDFMRMLMPSHAKNVQPYKEKTPLFLKYGVEGQLDAMYQPTVRLKSGGYLVIHQTEALVAIDVNSGKSTRERNIELTALKTNIEAAREAARQCRLRDLAGLVVIDFIDMMENRNNRAVEKALKDALKGDRARIQVGRISNFGLMEMSRQRRRSSIVEGTTHTCPTCSGSGTVRSNEMAALRILRAVEADALSGRAAVVTIKASLDVALYMLNHKRAWLKRIEDDYALSIEIVADSTKAGDQYDIEKSGAPRELPEAPAAIRPDQIEAPVEAIESEEEAEDAGEIEAEGEPAASGEASGRKRRRRRRGRRREEGGAPSDETVSAQPAGEGDEEDDASAGETERAGAEGDEDQAAKKRRRRGRRGGRRSRRRPENGEAGAEAGAQASDEAFTEDSGAVDAEDIATDAAAPEFPEIGYTYEEVVMATPEPASDEVAEERQPEPAAAAPVEERVEEAVAAAPQSEAEEAPKEEASREPKTARRGWWQRAIGG